MTRRWIAAAVLVVWAAAIALLLHRRANVPLAELLARGAAELQPETYFYGVYQSGVHVGVASSSIDTSTSGMRATDILHGRVLVYGDTQTVIASSKAYLTRGLALDSFDLSVGGDQAPFHLRGAPKTRSGVLLPTLAPVALMLSGKAKVGRSESFWIFNPLSQRVERTTLTIAAESLFSVVDSAGYDAAHRTWAPAHSDTVRAWSVTTPSVGLSAWVDAHGRLVSASEPGGLALMRTAYELARLEREAKR